MCPRKRNCTETETLAGSYSYKNTSHQIIEAQRNSLTSKFTSTTFMVYIRYLYAWRPWRACIVVNAVYSRGDKSKHESSQLLSQWKVYCTVAAIYAACASYGLIPRLHLVGWDSTKTRVIGLAFTCSMYKISLPSHAYFTLNARLNLVWLRFYHTSS